MMVPYARDLRERLKWGNNPFMVIICVGKDCWRRAKAFERSGNDFSALVYPEPGDYDWPVDGQSCLIEWDTGPSEEQIEQLKNDLLASGAITVRIVRRQKNERRQ